MNKVVIILPTYNEADNIPILLPQIFAQQDKIPSHELHVLIVDDNSPDGTSDVAKELMHSFANLHLISGEKKGLGEAYKRRLIRITFCRWMRTYNTRRI
jgi:dolichol-phosphate mannosyltransferase